jgi:DNA-directed RNA polymerase specialized sigma24 family protein
MDPPARINRYLQERHAEVHVPNEYPDPSPSPEDLAEAAERRAIVWRELRRCPMSSQARKVMSLRMEGLTYEAIGAEVGCSWQRVEQIIKAVFVTLKPRLERALA